MLDLMYISSEGLGSRVSSATRATGGSPRGGNSAAIGEIAGTSKVDLLKKGKGNLPGNSDWSVSDDDIKMAQIGIDPKTGKDTGGGNYVQNEGLRMSIKRMNDGLPPSIPDVRPEGESDNNANSMMDLEKHLTPENMIIGGAALVILAILAS